jgi:hypothetical protein
MLKGLLGGLLVLVVAMGGGNPVWASSIPVEKLKAYAQIYPDLFRQNGNKQTEKQSRAVTLLLNSFNGDTDVNELSAALRHGGPSSAIEPVSPIKPESQIKQLVVAKGLQWEEFQQITHTLASNPEEFKDFRKQLDWSRLNRSMFNRTNHDVSLINQINSLDQQIIVKNLLASAATSKK